MPILQSMLEKEVFFIFFFIFFYIFFYIFFFIFSSFKGVPVVRTTYQEGAGLPNYEGKIRDQTIGIYTRQYWPIRIHHYCPSGVDYWYEYICR